MKRKKSKGSKLTLFFMFVLFAGLFGISVILLYGIIAENIYPAEWQRKIDNHEVIATMARVTHLEISDHLLVTGRRGETTIIHNCSFTYVYTVDGKTYSATETYRDSGESLCYHTNVKEIKIYYEPQNVGNSISEKMGHEGVGN